MGHGASSRSPLASRWGTGRPSESVISKRSSGFARDSPLERDGSNLQFRAATPAAAGALNEQPAAGCAPAFLDPDVAKRRPAVASPSPPLSNPGIVPWCHHLVLSEAHICRIWSSEAAASSTRRAGATAPSNAAAAEACSRHAHRLETGLARREPAALVNLYPSGVGRLHGSGGERTLRFSGAAVSPAQADPARSPDSCLRKHDRQWIIAIRSCTGRVGCASSGST
jgi:hypothetical protein